MFNGLEKTRDALKRCQRILADTVRMELSPGSWGVLEPENWNAIDDENYDIPKEGPEWTGLPGTHPLLQIIEEAIKEINQLEKNHDNP